MTEKEIVKLFDWTISEYLMLKKECEKERFGYLTAIADIFMQITNYQKE